MIDLKSPQVGIMGVKIFTILQNEKGMTKTDILNCFALFTSFAIKYASVGDDNKQMVYYEQYIKLLGELMEITPEVKS